MQQVADDVAARCNEIPPVVARERVKQAECARRLGINRSSLKRYLEQYPELLDQAGKVEFEEVRQHRADNPRVVDAEIAVSSEKPAKAAVEGRKGAKHRLEEARATDAELDLAVKLGKLVDPDEWIDGLTEAGLLLREKFMGVDPVLCERLATESDPRTILSILREHNRKIVDEAKRVFDDIVKKAAGVAPKADEGV